MRTPYKFEYDIEEGFSQFLYWEEDEQYYGLIQVAGLMDAIFELQPHDVAQKIRIKGETIWLCLEVFMLFGKVVDNREVANVKAEEFRRNIANWKAQTSK